MATVNHKQGWEAQNTMFTILCNVSDTLIHRTEQASEVRAFLKRDGRNPKAFAIYTAEPELCTGIRGDAWLRLDKHGADLDEINRHACRLATELNNWLQAHADAEYILRRQSDMLRMDLEMYALCAQPATKTWQRRPELDSEDIPF